jgi:predicted PP-loop superfamily ATPase
VDDLERILEQRREHHVQGRSSETLEERVQNNTHRHVKRNEMDAEEHERVNPQHRENNVLNRPQMIDSKRMRGIEIHMRRAAQEDFKLTVASIDDLEPL